MPGLMSPVKGAMNLVGLRQRGASKMKNRGDVGASITQEADREHLLALERRALLEKVEALADIDNEHIVDLILTKCASPLGAPQSAKDGRSPVDGDSVTSSVTVNTGDYRDTPPRGWTAAELMEEEARLMGLSLRSLYSICSFQNPNFDPGAYREKKDVVRYILRDIELDTGEAHTAVVTLEDGTQAVNFAFVADDSAGSLPAASAEGLEEYALPYEGDVANAGGGSVGGVMGTSPARDQVGAATMEGDAEGGEQQRVVQMQIQQRLTVDEQAPSQSPLMFFRDEVPSTDVPLDFAEYQEYARLARLTRADLANELSRCGLSGEVFRSEHECRIALVARATLAKAAISANLAGKGDPLGVVEASGFMHVTPSDAKSTGKIDQAESSVGRGRTMSEGQGMEGRRRSHSASGRLLSPSGASPPQSKQSTTSSRLRAVSREQVAVSSKYYFRQKLKTVLPTAVSTRKLYSLMTKQPESVIDKSLRKYKIFESWFRNRHEQIMAIIEVRTHLGELEGIVEDGASERVARVLGSSRDSRSRSRSRSRSLSRSRSRSLSRSRSRSQSHSPPPATYDRDREHSDSYDIFGSIDPFSGGGQELPIRERGRRRGRERQPSPSPPASPPRGRGRPATVVKAPLGPFYYRSKNQGEPQNSKVFGEYSRLKKLGSRRLEWLVRDCGLESYRFRDDHERVMAILENPRQGSGQEDIYGRRKVAKPVVEPKAATRRQSIDGIARLIGGRLKGGGENSPSSSPMWQRSSPSAEMWSPGTPSPPRQSSPVHAATMQSVPFGKSGSSGGTTLIKGPSVLEQLRQRKMGTFRARANTSTTATATATASSPSLSPERAEARTAWADRVRSRLLRRAPSSPSRQ